MRADAAVDEQHAPALARAVAQRAARRTARRSTTARDSIGCGSGMTSSRSVGPAGVDGQPVRAVGRDVRPRAAPRARARRRPGAPGARRARARRPRRPCASAAVTTELTSVARAAGVPNSRRVEVVEHGEDQAALGAQLGQPAQATARDRVGCHRPELPRLSGGRTAVCDHANPRLTLDTGIWCFGSSGTIPSPSSSTKNARANGDAAVAARTCAQSICSRSARAICSSPS